MILKRIKYSAYDELLDKLDTIDLESFFKSDTNPIIPLVDDSSEKVLIDNQEVDLEINIDNYNEINKNAKSAGESSVLIAKQLYNDFVYNGQRIATKLMYEKEFWTYMNLTLFFDLIRDKYFDDLKDISKMSDKEKKLLKEKIGRLYFNTGGLSKLDRTGLRFLWVLADLTYYKDNFDLLQIAWDFIDPFKAIQECVLGNNPYILKGFARAIQILDCDSKIKNTVNRTLVPLHIRNYACNHFVDAYTDIDELGDILAKQIKLIMN